MTGFALTTHRRCRNARFLERFGNVNEFIPERFGACALVVDIDGKSSSSIAIQHVLYKITF
jgi:hypothetical protein